MTRFATCARLGTFSALLAVLCAGQAAAQSPDAVARDLQRRYGRVTSLQADFVQTSGGQRVSGTLAVRGNAFRLDLAEQLLVTDGRTMWSYTADDRQVVVQDYDERQVGFSVGQLFTDYLRVFRATGATKATISGVQYDVLSLRPRASGSSVRDATLYVRSSDAVPTRVRVHDRNGGTLQFDVSNVRLNRALASSLFRFDAPRGTEVVDLR